LRNFNKNLSLYRNQNGVKLLTQHSEVNTTQFKHTGYTLDQLSKLPCNIYFLDTQGNTLHLNESCVTSCGFETRHDAIGKSLFEVSHAQSASELIMNCQVSIAQQKTHIFEEENIRKDGLHLQFLSFKTPWYNENNQIIGVFGCSIVLGKQPLAQSLTRIAELGLLVSNFSGPAKLIKDAPLLSPQEDACLHLLCKGLTLKEIAKTLQLSPKTVETYLNRAKQKLHCQNKAELISLYTANSGFLADVLR
jgi:DNA-binding CsgD family transcriptional regulator